MSIIVTFNGANYIIPTPNEVGWGTNLDNYFVAIAAGALQKTGGLFTLSAETDFGSSFGLKSLYYKSRNVNVSSTGIVRLANNSDAVSWRNFLGNGNLPLIVNASDQLTFNGTPIGGEGIFIPSRAIISNASGNITAATTTSTEIGYVNGVTSGIQGQLDSKLNLSGGTLSGVLLIPSSDLHLQEASGLDEVTIAVASLSASRIYTLPDTGTNSSFVMTDGAQTINGTKTFEDILVVESASGELDVRSTDASSSTNMNVTNSSSKGPSITSFGTGVGGLWNGHSVSGTLGLGLILSNNSIVMYPTYSGGFLSFGYFNGSTSVEQLLIDSSGSTFKSNVIITPTSNQLVLGTTRTVTLTAPTPASTSRTWTIPDITTNGTFAALEGTQTFSGSKTFSSNILTASSIGLVLKDNSINTVTIKATNSTTSYTFSLPTTAGSSNQYLTTDGLGNLTWTNAAGTGTVNSGTQYQLAYYATTTNAVSGTSSLLTNAAGQLIGTNGSASAPSLCVGTASNGIYLSATNEVSIASNGAQTIRFTSDNRVGIGGAPDPVNTHEILHVEGTSTGNNGVIDIASINNSTGGARILVQSDYTDANTTTLTSMNAQGTAQTGNWFSGGPAIARTSAFEHQNANNVIHRSLYTGTGNTGLTTHYWFTDQSSIAFSFYRNTGVTPTTAGYFQDGIWQINDGTASTPAYSFQSDTASHHNGMYKIGTDNIGFATKNTLALEITSTQTCILTGTSTNDNAAAGKVGEFAESVVTFASRVNSTGSGQWVDITSLTLSAGDWEVMGIIGLTANGATVTVAQVAITTTTGNSGAGTSFGDNAFVSALPNGAAGTNDATTPIHIRASLSGSATYYLKYTMTHTVATPQGYGNIRARRMR